MKKIALLFILLVNAIVFSQSKNIDLGKEFITTYLVERNIEKTYSFIDEETKIKITKTLLSDAINALDKQLGKFKSIIESNFVNETYYYYSDFEKMKLDIKVTFNDKNKIIGFFFSPHKDFKKENSLGKELVIKSDSINLKGTLLVPEKNNLKKIVLFVHGSGPNDRDETSYENKPFRDIAENLYQKGIASYRFDKRTFSNPESFNDKTTIDDEVTNDVINIINYFKKDSQFSEYEISIIGHSLGAHMMPRIANKSNAIGKVILLAGNARPLEELLVEQYNYLYSLTPTEELKEELQQTTEKVAFLTSKKFNLNSPKEKLPFSLSPYYWQSLLDYNPVKEIKKVKIPILILQGERDYQVTMTDFTIWKKALKNNTNATFISYPKLNHVFISGDGKPNPTEYAIKATVDVKVIEDIFNFIIK